MFGNFDYDIRIKSIKKRNELLRDKLTLCFKDNFDNLYFWNAPQREHSFAGCYKDKRMKKIMQEVDNHKRRQ